MKKALSVFLSLMLIFITSSCTTSNNNGGFVDVAEEVVKEKFPYYLYVEKGTFTLTVYTIGEDGKYSVPYKSFKIAHGGNKTPVGVFTIGKKQRWHEFPLGGFAQYASHYSDKLYIHSPLYEQQDENTLWRTYYDGEKAIGTASSGGCIRMVTEGAKFIYENCPDGTKLEIVNGSPRGTNSESVPPLTNPKKDPTDN